MVEIIRIYNQKMWILVDPRFKKTVMTVEVLYTSYTFHVLLANYSIYLFYLRNPPVGWPYTISYYFVVILLIKINV